METLNSLNCSTLSMNGCYIGEGGYVLGFVCQFLKHLKRFLDSSGNNSWILTKRMFKGLILMRGSKYISGYGEFKCGFLRGLMYVGMPALWSVFLGYAEVPHLSCQLGLAPASLWPSKNEQYRKWMDRRDSIRWYCSFNLSSATTTRNAREKQWFQALALLCFLYIHHQDFDQPVHLQCWRTVL